MLSTLFDKITRLSIRYRWLTIILTAVFLVAGIWSATQLNLELVPSIEFPQTVVVVQWPDAESSDQFLNDITIPLEEKMQAIEGVVNIESTTNSTFAFVIVRNDFGMDQDKMVTDIETAVAEMNLPDTAETNVLNFSLSDLPIVVASVSASDLTLPELKALVEADLKPALERLAGVSQVTVGGGQELPEDIVADAVEPTPEPTATPRPGKLPAIVVEGAKSLGMDIEYVQDVTPAMLADLEGTDEQVIAILNLIPDELLLYALPETLALLPTEYLNMLDADLLAQLDDLAAAEGGIGRYNIAQARAILDGADPAEVLAEAEPTPEPEATAVPEPVELVAFEPVELPESLVEGATAMGITLTTTADITLEVLTAVAQTAPEMMAELTPEMWRAIHPDVIAPVLPLARGLLDPELVAQLTAIQNAANGVDPDPVPLPEAWIEGTAAMGFPLATTADIPPNAADMMMGDLPSEMMADLTPEIMFGLHPDILAVLPTEFVATLDEGVQQTLTNIAIARANYVTEATAVVEEDTPVEEVDPARLPDMLVQASESFGQKLEYAQDLTPDLIRMLNAAGPQAAQFFTLLTPDNLRLMPAESIALLPADFLDGLDSDLRAELDELAAEYDGAGQLAIAEADEAAAASSESPALAGIWLEPGEDGEEPMFTTAYDLLNNGFMPTAADLLNFLPDSPNAAFVPQLMYDLTPEAMAYLAVNEEGFAANLSPLILEMMSPETLTFLLDTYPDAFDAELTATLRGIAAGDVEVFIPETSITRTDGNASVVVIIYKEGDANTVEVAHLVFDTLDTFEATHASASTFLSFEQATFIEDSIAGVSREGALGGVFAILVILLFLSGTVGGKYKFSWRATLVTAVSIPLSIFTAFLLMYLVPPTLGININDWAANSNSEFLSFVARLFPVAVTLNIMTLSGLTVAIGRVVDDSIVVLENSYRYIQQGENANEAIIHGTREVAVAIFAATVTTMVVFLPLGLVGGIIGSFFLPFGLTVTYALAASFVVSITVVPALMSIFINKENIPEEKETALQRWYTPALVWSLNHRFITMLISTVIFVGSLFLLTQLPQSFIPGLGEPTINISAVLPSGTKITETNDLVTEFEAIVFELEGVETVQTEIGSGGGLEAFFSGGGGVSQNQANLTISIANQKELDTLTQQVRQAAQQTFGEENVTVSAASQTGFSGFSLTLTGDSLAELLPVVADVKAALEEVDVDGDGVPDIANVSSTADDFLSGNGAGNGNEVIIRIDGRPAISFSGELETDNTLGVTNIAKQELQNLPNLPSGAEVTEGFESQQQVEGFQGMIRAIFISIGLVYLIMALTFRSLILPFTILFSLPFALVGAAAALWLSNSVLGISAMIGFMMLVGIVVTNGIVLMELVQQLRVKGSNTYDALVEGGRTRLRPIWMTALTAILALVPLAFSQEAGAIIASELGRAVMGGLLVSTALTLIVVPVMFSSLDQLSDWISNKVRRN